MTRYLIYIFLVFGLTVTANAQMPLSKGEKNRQKEYIKEHGDMDPQRTIEAPAERIKPLLTLIMIQGKYLMDSETPSQLVFSQELTGMRAVGVTLLLGNSYSETPKRTLRFILMEQNGKTLVSASGEITVRMAMGNVNRTALNNKDFNASVQLIFDGVERLLSQGIPEVPEDMRQAAIANIEAEKSSPAAAAAMATVGHIPTPQELAALIQSGQASRCSVITNPAGAEIYIDGNKAGVSPLVFVLLKKGDTPRLISIKLSGYMTVEKQVVPDGKVIPFGLTLEKQSEENIY